MNRIEDSGIWALFEPGVGAGALYKYAIQHESGEIRVKADPFAFAAELRPSFATSQVVDAGDFIGPMTPGWRRSATIRFIRARSTFTRCIWAPGGGRRTARF